MLIDDLIDRLRLDEPEKRKTLLSRSRTTSGRLIRWYLVRMGVIAGVSSKLDW